MLIGQLLKPLGYLAIRHPFKWVIDWLYPVILSVVTFFICYYSADLVVLVEKDGFIGMLLSFVQSLPGFYIAALAAIATFGRADIDQILPEPTPRVIVKYRGKENLVNLTRRRFLAMLFAFLTAESIILILFSIFIISYGKLVFASSVFFVGSGSYLGAAAIFIYFVLLYQMVLATFWGLFYLGYKLHENN